jgi:hypothetical protein
MVYAQLLLYSMQLRTAIFTLNSSPFKAKSLTHAQLTYEL